MSWTRFAEDAARLGLADIGAVLPADQADALLNIDVQGAAAVATAFRVFLLPPSMEELEGRLRGRGTDSDEEMAQRLETAREEMARQDEFDVRVVNDDSRRAAEEIAAALA